MTSNYVFSAAALTFYPVSLQSRYESAGTWPADGVEVEDDIYREFRLDAAPVGMVCGADPDGHPVWVPAPPRSTEEIIAQNRGQRDSLLSTATDRIAPLQDAVDLGMATEAEAAALLDWKRYRVLLNRVNLEQPVWPAAPTP